MNTNDANYSRHPRYIFKKLRLNPEKIETGTEFLLRGSTQLARRSLDGVGLPRSVKTSTDHLNLFYPPA